MTDSLASGAQDTTDRSFALVNGYACRLEDVLLSKKNNRGTAMDLSYGSEYDAFREEVSRSFVPISTSSQNRVMASRAKPCVIGKVFSSSMAITAER